MYIFPVSTGCPNSTHWYAWLLRMIPSKHMSTLGCSSCSHDTAELPSRCFSSQVPATNPGTLNNMYQVFRLSTICRISIYNMYLQCIYTPRGERSVVSQVCVPVVHVLGGGGRGGLPGDHGGLVIIIIIITIIIINIIIITLVPFPR